MDYQAYQHIYFLGIGGIGMSNIARYFNAKGYCVSGYDKVKTKLTDQLESEGIAIDDVDDITHIPADIISNRDHTLVVFTPAIPTTNIILNYLLQKEYEIVKRAKVLGKISEGTLSLAVAGTHGKTTTTSILAHILHQSSIGCNAFLGGIATNYNSNLILNDHSPVSVLEADEYDRSFLNLSPSMAIITSMDPDHLDIYNEGDSFRETFVAFAHKIKPNGVLVHHDSLSAFFEKLDRKKITYGVQSHADYRAINIGVENAAFTFDVQSNGEFHGGFELQLPGQHNVENALAAIAIAVEMNVPWAVIQENISTYQGVLRRFQFHFRSENHFFIDDYAHHPTEIDAVIHAARQLFPKKKITCIFQPHLFSRTRDFMPDFAKSLAQFDEIILLDIYPAREKPMEGITSKTLLEMIPKANKSLFAKEDVLDHIIGKELEVLFTLGAGDISSLVQPIKRLFEKKYT